jgi:ankyrin repeat protein
MNMEEMNQEVLECARYGEEEDLRALLNAGADVNFTDVGGSSAMHKAAANGEEACLKVLHQFGAKYAKNGQGNTPAHWAAQNGKAAALKFIIQNYEVDVLCKNDLGRSILTEAFQSKCTDCIELCLSHDSASEERLINPDGKAAAPAQSADAGGATETDTQMQVDSTEDEAQNAEANAITHTMQFGEARIRMRELPITRADNPFGTETAPEDDTTGEFTCAPPFHYCNEKH